MHDIDCFDHHMHSVTYKTSVLRKSNYQQTEGISYTDTEWIFYPMRNVITISYYNRNVYKYLVGRDGQTIEETTVAKRVDQLILISKRMLEEFYSDETGIKSCAYDYMRNIIFRTINYIYHVIIISCKSECNEKKLVDFDQWLNEKYIYIYNRLDETTFNNTSFKYIYQWRLNGRKKIQDGIINKYENQDRKYHKLLRLKRMISQIFTIL